MDFVQKFKLEDSICDYIISNLQIPEDLDEPAKTPAEIPELLEPINAILRNYFNIIREFNYFVYPNEITCHMETTINCIPPWTYVMYKSETGKHINFYAFLKDTESTFEVFNPFTKDFFRLKSRKGDVVVLPAAWLFLTRHTSTLHTSSLFIAGTACIHDFYDVHEA